MLETAFTRLAGVEHPVVCAGMGAGIADGELAGRVSEAGGLGVIGASWLDAETVRDMAVGEMGTTVIARQVAEAVAPVPVLAAGGFADGAGLASPLALGAEGVVFGTRFLAAAECPIPAWLKQAIVASDGHDTVRTTVPDTLSGRDWPGAWSRVLRTRLIEEWLGREPELRRRRREVLAELETMDGEEEPDSWRFWVGQSAGLVDGVEPAGEVVRRIVAEAEEILRSRLPGMLA